MGSDAELYLFNIKAFQNHIIPGFHKLLKGQTLPQWVNRIIDLTDYYEMNEVIEVFKSKPLNLEEHCSYLGKELDCVDPGRFNPNLGRKPRNVCYVQYQCTTARKCAEEDCLANQNCPFYIDSTSDIAELLNYFFEYAIAWLCQGEEVFVGRSSSPAKYEEKLSQLGVTEDSHLRELLDRLGTRGFIIGYGWSNGDGVHGWLNDDECDELSTQLWQLSLPQYPSNLENLETWQPLKKRDSEYDWGDIVLAYIRAMSEYAAKEHLGIVWMNDVSTKIREQMGQFKN